MFEIHPLNMIGEVQPSSDLVAMLSEAPVAARLSVSRGDVLVVTQRSSAVHKTARGTNRF
jgi:hypothetical protein